MKEFFNYFYLLVVEFPKQLWAEAEAVIRARMDKRRVRKVIQIARIKTQTDRKHRYVVRDTTGKVIAVTAMQIDLMRRKGILPKHITCVSIYKHALEIVRYKHGTSNQMGSGVKVKE